MRDTSHLVVVHALDLVDFVVQVPNLPKVLFVENVTLVSLHGHRHHVRATKGVTHLVVSNDIFMSLR